jgi:hypothetical protein
MPTDIYAALGALVRAEACRETQPVTSAEAGEGTELPRPDQEQAARRTQE